MISLDEPPSSETGRQCVVLEGVELTKEFQPLPPEMTMTGPRRERSCDEDEDEGIGGLCGVNGR